VLQTPVCDVLGVDVPIVQGSFGPWTNAELSAAVSAAGGLGSVGTALLDANRVRELIRQVRELTDRPFAVNFTARPLVDDVFEAVLAEAPAVVSYALGDPAELPTRVHDAGAVFVQQVHTVEHARTAAERGVDVFIAQGSEAGGFGGTVGVLALLPQVVDAVAPLPVLVAGGVADGRGLAAALLLGAQGANIGTRFLASTEAGIPQSWKQDIVEAESEDAVKVDFADAVFPPAPADGYAVVPACCARRSWTCGTPSCTLLARMPTAFEASSPTPLPKDARMSSFRSPGRRPGSWTTFFPSPRSCVGSSPKRKPCSGEPLHSPDREHAGLP
jgi:enoyl-[acyl-carrier protein] reductase II